MPDYLINDDADVGRIIACIARRTCPVYVTIKDYKRSRSRAQNALFWQWCSQIARHTGHTQQEIHNYYCATYLPINVSVVAGRVVQTTRTTSGLDVDEFAALLTAMQADAPDTFGIQLDAFGDLLREALRCA